MTQENRTNASFLETVLRIDTLVAVTRLDACQDILEDIRTLNLSPKDIEIIWNAGKLEFLKARVKK